MNSFIFQTVFAVWVASGVPHVQAFPSGGLGIGANSGAQISRACAWAGQNKNLSPKIFVFQNGLSTCDWGCETVQEVFPARCAEKVTPESRTMILVPETGRTDTWVFETTINSTGTLEWGLLP